MRILDAWPRLSGAPDLTRFSRKVLVNLYLDHRRRPSRRERPTDSIPEDQLADADPTTRQLLREALQEVPSGQRAVLVLRYFEDFSVEQTAETLRTSPGNVKSQSSRGLASLRRALEGRGISASFDLLEQQ